MIYEFKIIGIIVGITISSLVVLSLLLNGILFFAEMKSCESWGKGTGRETKFVASYPWYVDCLVKTDSGWISNHNLYQNETPDIK